MTTYAEIQEQIRLKEKELEEARQQVIRQVKDLMVEWKLTPQDIGHPQRRARKPRQPK